MSSYVETISDARTTLQNCNSSDTREIDGHQESSDPSTAASLAFLRASFTGTTELNRLLRIVSKASAHLFLSERGMSGSEAKVEFLRDWLLNRLSRYGDPETQRKAALSGELRYLPRQSRNALIDKLRRRSRLRDALDTDALRLDQPLGNWDDEVQCDLHHLLGLHSELAFSSPIGRSPSLEPSVLLEKLEEVRPELTQNLGEKGFAVLSVICHQFPDGLSLGNVTRSIATALRVSDQTARKFHRDIVRTLQKLKREPAVRAFAELIASANAQVLVTWDVWDECSD